MDDKKWFDIKALVDLSSVDKTKEMKSDMCGKHIKTVLDRLNLCCNKLLHLGRNIGTRILELLEEEQTDIDNMGQWSSGTQQHSYSTKLPMAPIHKLARCYGSRCMHFYTQTTIKLDDDLLLSTPMGAWCYRAHQDLSATASAST